MTANNENDMHDIGSNSSSSPPPTFFATHVYTSWVVDLGEGTVVANGDDFDTSQPTSFQTWGPEEKEKEDDDEDEEGGYEVSNTDSNDFGFEFVGGGSFFFHQTLEPTATSRPRPESMEPSISPLTVSSEHGDRDVAFADVSVAANEELLEVKTEEELTKNEDGATASAEKEMNENDLAAEDEEKEDDSDETSKDAYDKKSSDHKHHNNPTTTTTTISTITSSLRQQEPSGSEKKITNQWSWITLPTAAAAYMLMN